MAKIRSSASSMKTKPTTETPHNDKEASLSAGLYVVATPIGNLGDITSRALDTLRRVDIVACEDTRVTAKLMNAFLIKKPLIPYHEHNGQTQRPKLISKIKDGKSIALVSDAGTPLISDPGYKLVADVAASGLKVTTLPGPSAVVSALTLAGLPTDRFIFMGFSPNKTNARRNWFEAEKDNSATLVYYESARRLLNSLKDARYALKERSVVVCREISKKFEEVVRGNLDELVDYYETNGEPKGEVVVVIAPPSKQNSQKQNTNIETDKLLSTALKYMSVKTAAAFVAEVSGEKKNPLYKKALELSAETSR
ncbi:16S rRNA (cytidine(1402)-2'-O)-methyltransferase [Kordiimonas aquimaris]|uniref:16S rRNA (cytidine(1402)-2'-O)-methyltransferase n=1 Tax=Kordiimonas aquimaris TaxID=707591 RepID=UPI0021D0F3DD|nr:16S rRNA (cytidine(1402)-2'-O)-methyltransferase [Kordiimonas aquimaris]